MSTTTPTRPHPIASRPFWLFWPWAAILFIMSLMVWWPAFAFTLSTTPLAAPFSAPQGPSATQTRTELELIRLHRESTLTGMALLTAQPSLNGSTPSKDSP